MTKPPLEEAIRDLSNIRGELEHMRTIRDSAEFLSKHEDCDAAYYSRLLFKVMSDIQRGEHVEQLILDKYPEIPR